MINQSVPKYVEPRPLYPPPEDPQIADLQEWVRRGFENAYQHRRREQASRADFADGWISCLLFQRSFGSFKPRDPVEPVAEHPEGEA